MNSAVKNVLTKFIIGIVIGLVLCAAFPNGDFGIGTYLGFAWMGTGIVFCPKIAKTIAQFLGGISSFAGVPGVIVGYLFGGVFGLCLGPIFGIYHLILAITSGSDS